MDKISIIMAHWAMSETRSDVMKRSVMSLINTTTNVPAEIIIVDNGASLEDSRFLLDMVQDKRIQYYVRNSENLYFGNARNQGTALSCGNILVFTDNDIEYKPGWVELGLGILNAYPEDKIAFTPLRTDSQHRNELYWRGELEHDGKQYLCNSRAGSNSWMIRRKDFEKIGIGRFINHKIAGSHWANDFVNAGYKMVTMEKDSLAIDMGFRQGYNFKTDVELNKVFTNGEKLRINEIR